LLPLSSVSARHFFICSVWSLLLCWARAEFFLDASAQPACHAADFFSLFGRFSSALSARAPVTFFWGCLVSALHANVRAPCSIFWSPLCSSVSARTEIFCGVRSASAVHAEIFFSLIGHFCTAVWASCCRFFLSPLHSHACLSGALADFFSGQQQLRAQFFLSQPHSTVVCAAFCSCDRSLCHPRSKETIFFVTSVQQCEGYRARRTFLLRSSFSFAVWSHLRRHLVLFFCTESLQYTFSESCVRNLIFWHLPSAVSGSLTTLVRTS
jgi:hypothetical protein